MASSAENLVNTSVDDCRCSLSYITDVDLLRKALALALERGHVTRAQVLSRRINQLSRGVA